MKKFCINLKILFLSHVLINKFLDQYFSHHNDLKYSLNRFGWYGLNTSKFKQSLFNILLYSIITYLSSATVPAAASTVFQTYNADKGSGFALPRPPCCTWSPDTIGWYWTPNQDIYLESIQTKLADVDFGYDNGFNMKVGVFTDRPAVGGTLLASFTFDAAHFLAGYEPWRGGFFANPLQVSANTTYFVGLSGWESGRYSFTGGHGGINWVIDGNTGLPPVNAEFIGTAYIGSQWETLIGTSTTVTAAPVLQFVGSPTLSQVPLPAALFLMLSGLGLIPWQRKNLL